MSDSERPKIGSVGWIDLTVDDADSLHQFYSRVVGWTPQPFDMGGYNDYVMQAEDGTATTGVCHARGGNAGLPAQWMIYINVADLDASMKQCEELGGSILSPVRTMPGQGRYCMIQDPAGAVCALFEPV